MAKMPDNRSTKTGGFTLLELMITMAIAGIILGIAVPSFQAFMQNGRMTSSFNELQKTIKIARDEAVARNTKVTLCATADGTTCSNSNTWETGYLVAVSSPFTLISTHQGLADDQTLRAPGSTASLTFIENGTLRTNSSFLLCDERGTEHSRGLILSMGGVRMAEENDNLGNCP